MFAQADKPKPLGFYLKQLRGGDTSGADQHVQALSFFHALRARGLPVSIERTKLN